MFKIIDIQTGQTRDTGDVVFDEDGGRFTIAKHPIGPNGKYIFLSGVPEKHSFSTPYDPESFGLRIVWRLTDD